MIDDYMRRMRLNLERDIGRLLAPELSRTNAAAVYIVFATEAGLDGSRLNVRGLAGPWLSATYREALADRWRGHGPCVLVNDSTANGGSSAAIANATDRPGSVTTDRGKLWVLPERCFGLSP